MKKSKAPSQIEHAYEKYYNDPSGWCPFFGNLPSSPEELQYPDSIVSRCISIIDKARLICAIPEWRSNSTSPDPDIIKEQTGFSKQKILSARAIFARSDTIIYNARFYTADPHLRGDAYINVKGKSKLSVGADQVDIDKLRSEIYWTIGTIQSDEFQDYEISALLAISEAWLILQDILYYDEEDCDHILRDIRVAELLLARAERNNPDAKRGKANVDGGIRGAQIRWSNPNARERQIQRNEIVEKKAQDIEANNKNISPTGIAKKIAEKTKIPIETVRKTPAIKNRIKQKKQNSKAV